MTYQIKLERLLARMGGAYQVRDILDRIKDGQMQSFADGEAWAVTQICDLPRARVLEIVVALGDLQGVGRLHSRILQFANDNDIGLLQAYGRRGWLGHPLTAGWKIKTKTFLYQREM